MSLFGQARDISMFRYVNRELMGNIISQQIVYYQYELAQTKVNIYGEAAEARNFLDPVILFALIEPSDFNYPESDFGVDFEWQVTYKFLRDDLVDAGIVPEVGDIIMYQNGYWEVDGTNATQFFVGKDPEYPYTDSNGNNPLNPGLDQFGYNTSVICKCHYVPADRLGIIPQRL